MITQFILFESNSVKEDLSTLFDDLFEHKLVRGRTLYFSSRLNKGGKPMCIIDPKDELKALTLMVQSKKIIIKVIVNKTKEKGLGKKIVDRLVKFADKNSYQVMIDDDQSKGFWDAQISKYGNKLQKIDEGLLDYFKKKEVDPNKTHYEMGDIVNLKLHGTPTPTYYLIREVVSYNINPYYIGGNGKKYIKNTVYIVDVFREDNKDNIKFIERKEEVLSYNKDQKIPDKIKKKILDLVKSGYNIDEGLLDYFKKKEIEVDPNKTHYEMGDFLLISPKNFGDCKAIVIRDMLEEQDFPAYFFGKNILDKKYIYDEFWFSILDPWYNNDYKIGDPIYKGRKKGRLSYHEKWLKNVDSVGIRDKIWKVIRSKEFKDILDQSNL